MLKNNNSNPVLLFSEGISYCHVVRPLIVGKWLQETECQILVACVDRHRSLFEGAGFSTVTIETADPKLIYNRLARGKTLYCSEELIDYCRKDSELLDEVDPSLVIADFRFTLLQLAKQRGLPTVGITSASCHPNFTLNESTPNPWIWPSFVPAATFDFVQKTVLGSILRKQTVRELSRPYQTASRVCGLPVLDTFFEYASQGDLCLLSDHPAVMPVDRMRPQDLYTGALIWHAVNRYPRAWKKSGRNRAMGERWCISPWVLKNP